MNALNGKTILVTGAARRVGRIFALACARAGADVVIHHAHSEQDARQVKDEIESLGRRAHGSSPQTSGHLILFRLISQANEFSPLYALVNSAAIFEPLSFHDTRSMTGTAT
jgi:NAD(P)-dependent dehydrogenase (short-subunit alcohol dehydrogenase family)